MSTRSKEHTVAEQLGQSLGRQGLPQSMRESENVQNVVNHFARSPTTQPHIAPCVAEKGMKREGMMITWDMLSWIPEAIHLPLLASLQREQKKPWHAIVSQLVPRKIFLSKAAMLRLCRQHAGNAAE